MKDNDIWKSPILRRANFRNTCPPHNNILCNIDNIISSNKKNSDHIITLCYQNTCTEDENEMRTIKKNFTEKIPTSDPNWFEKTTQYYDIILDYDEAGYVNKITIE